MRRTPLTMSARRGAGLAEIRIVCAAFIVLTKLKAVDQEQQEKRKRRGGRNRSMQVANCTRFLRLDLKIRRIADALLIFPTRRLSGFFPRVTHLAIWLRSFQPHAVARVSSSRL